MNEIAGQAPDSQDVRQWAFATLRIAPGLDAVATKAGLLSALVDQEFVPRDDVHDAIEVLANLRGSGLTGLPPAYDRERESERGDEVEHFANQFFGLKVPARREIWERLSQSCAAWPPLRLRLARLKLLLDLAITFSDASHSPQSLEFERLVCELLVRRPWNRHSRFDDQLHAVHRDWSKWQPIARSFRRRHPALAKRARAFVNDIADHSRKLRWAGIREKWRRFTGEWFPKSGNQNLTPKHWATIGLFLVGCFCFGIIMELRDPSSQRPHQSFATPTPNPTPNPQWRGLVQPPEILLIRIKLSRGETITANEQERLRAFEKAVANYPLGDSKQRD